MALFLDSNIKDSVTLTPIVGNSVERYFEVAPTHRSRTAKMETFSGRPRPDWQRKPGTKAAVASRQNRSELRRTAPLIRRIPKRKIWLHIKN